VGSLAPSVLLDALKREKLKRLAESSLYEFTKQAWPIIEPGTEFRSSWHLETICEHLEAVATGEIQNLLINIPPGFSKSIISSVMWPAWMWVVDPAMRHMSASYGEDLAVRDAMKTRDIVTSEWYQRNWGYVQIAKGQDQKTHYALTESGWRLATSVGGRATGLHPDIKIVDDPHSASQAASDAERQRACDWFTGTLATRGVSRNAKTVVIMQRLHEQDVSGLILDRFSKEYEHLCLPMRYEASIVRKPTSLGFKDPRSVDGALLWPELFPEKVVKQLESALGEYGSAGQLAQRPAPSGGGIIKTSKIQKWPAGKELPVFDYVVQSWDTAFTEKTTGDPSAMTVWGTARHEGKQIAILLDCFAERMGYPALKKRVLEEWKSCYGESARRADTILVEQKASGQSILQDLRQTGIPARAYNPGKADKMVRTHAVAPLFDAGIVYIPESTKNKGEFVTWAQPLLKEAEVFPNGAHDDLWDTTTQGLIYLKDSGWLASDVYADEEEAEYADDRRVKANPYGA